MKSFQLINYLTSNTDLQEEQIHILIDTLETRSVAKGDKLLRQGDYCEHTFFVEKGILKLFSIDDIGKEHIIQFAPENWWVSDRESMYFHRPSNYYIEAIEDSEVLLVDDEFLKNLQQSSPKFNEFNLKLLNNHIRQLQNRIQSLLSDSAEKRYLDFISIYPDLLLRIPQWTIAAYLGITPESLSRVRKELATRSQKS